MAMYRTIQAMSSSPRVFATSSEALMHTVQQQEPAAFSMMQTLQRKNVVNGWAYYPIYRYGDILQSVTYQPSYELVLVRNYNFATAENLSLPFNILRGLHPFNWVYLRCKEADAPRSISVGTIYVHLPSEQRWSCLKKSDLQ
jgi:hypothetical protein